MKKRSIRTLVCVAGMSLALLAAGCSSPAVQPEEGNVAMATEAAETKSQTESASEETETEELETQIIEEEDPFESQTSIDEALAQEAENGYSFEEPSVILDPYGTSPLSAVIVFSTEEEMGGTITVKGKAPENDISGTFPAERNHIVPVYGLYNGETTQVELALEDGTTNTVEITTEKLDINIGTIEIDMKDSTAYDYSSLTMVCSSGGSLLAVDGAGDVRWYYTAGGTLGVHQLENGHLMTPTAFTLTGMYYKSGLQEIDLSGKVYKEYAIPGGMHHDFQELSNGNLLVAGDSPELTSLEDYVVEIDRETGAVVWELDMADLLDKEDGTSASMLLDGSEEIDWFHNNGVWYDEANDLILLSARHLDAIVAVKKSDKSLAWILGDPTGWELDEKYFFTPKGENFEWQYAQHQVTMLDNGDIMMFDNGSAKVKAADIENKVTGDEVYSRAVIYHIDTKEMTIEQVYEYGKERGAEWYSDWISGVISLDGTQNNLWITAGSNLYNPEEDSHDYGPTGMMTPGLIKTTHINQVINGELIFEMKISGETYASLTYRSLRMPLYTEEAGLDVSVPGTLAGGLGQTKEAEAEISFEQVENLETEGWSFGLDAAKMTVKGVYKTKTASEALGDGYLVLKNGEDVKAYSLTQYGTDGEEGTSVAVSGWVSPTGLEGNTFEVYLVLDGTTFQTGQSVEF